MHAVLSGVLQKAGRPIMDENISFEDIMKEITHGLTGDPASDMK